jgi:adenylate cyclase
VFHLLAYLIRHRHRVASTTELLTQLWPGQVVTTSSLTRCVVKARKALRNTGSQQLIQNHYGHGYRFVAETGVKTALIHGQTRNHSNRWQRQPPSNPAAYDYYLRAAESIFRFTPEDQAVARQMYEHAIALDQHYAAAYAGLAWTYWLEWSWFWNQDPRLLEQALTFAQQAVSLDDSLPFAHLTLGYVYLFKRQYTQAIAKAEHSIHLDQGYAWGYGMLADMQTAVGRPQEAIVLIEKAMQLEPQSAGYFSASLGLAYRALGQCDEAIAAVRRTLTRNPCVVSARLLLTILYSETHRQKEARQELARLRQQLPQLSREGLRQRFPYQDHAETERVLTALCKAGLR